MGSRQLGGDAGMRSRPLAAHLSLPDRGCHNHVEGIGTIEIDQGDKHIL